ncbi:C-GCAxxG-C-C family protein [Marinifilum sp.]|uniref:C-GCAxxG-C-C family protein n=1 Tax=Marinifilum sp. TaxID=2033137 RepID=UPI003BAC7CF5
MITKKEKAVENFRSGMNCAQSVLLAFSDQYKFDDNLAFQISSGFGGGMGRLQKTCGAVTGAFMLIGIHNCEKYSNHSLQTENNRSMIQEFNRRFTQTYESLDCRDIIKCDLNTPEGQQYCKENNSKEIICTKCITDSIDIVNALITQ